MGLDGGHHVFKAEGCAGAARVGMTADERRKAAHAGAVPRSQSLAALCHGRVIGIDASNLLYQYGLRSAMRLYGAGADADYSNVVALVLDFVSRLTKEVQHRRRRRLQRRWERQLHRRG